MITRTYSCLNRRCQTEFDATADHPPCPRCRGLRVQWVPKPVAINSGATRQIDHTAARLAADFGMSNFRSPSRGKPASLAAAPAPVSAERNVFEPMPGWRINLPAAALSGAGAAVCAPTGVTAKVKVDPNAGPLKETNPATGMAALRAATVIEARHAGKVK